MMSCDYIWHLNIQSVISNNLLAKYLWDKKGINVLHNKIIKYLEEKNYNKSTIQVISTPLIVCIS